MTNPCCDNPNYVIDGDYAVCKNCGNARALAPTSHVITIDKAEVVETKIPFQVNAMKVIQPTEIDKVTTDGKG